MKSHDPQTQKKTLLGTFGSALPSARRSKHFIFPPKFTVTKDQRNTEGRYIVRFYLAGKNFSLSTFKTEKRAAEKAGEALVMKKWEEWKSSTFDSVQVSPTPPIPPTQSVAANPETAFALPTPQPSEVIPTSPSKTIIDATDEWLTEYGKERPKSASTVEAATRSWLKCLPYTLLNDLTTERLMRLQKQLIPLYSKRSADSLLTYLKKFCRWCLDKGYLASNPAEKIKPKMEGDYGGYETNKDVWPERFFKEFVEHFHVSEKRALRVYWETGIDLCDIARLEIKHIKLYADSVNYIELVRLKAKDKSPSSKEIIRFPLNKGTVINKLVMTAIERAKAKGRTLLFNVYGRTPKEFTSHLSNKRAAMFKAHYPDMELLTWKSLRATFFTRCRNAGIPDSALVRWGGWVDATQLSRVYDRGITTAQHTHLLNKPKAAG